MPFGPYALRALCPSGLMPLGPYAPRALCPSGLMPFGPYALRALCPSGLMPFGPYAPRALCPSGRRPAAGTARCACSFVRCAFFRRKNAWNKARFFTCGAPPRAPPGTVTVPGPLQLFFKSNHVNYFASTAAGKHPEQAIARPVPPGDSRPPCRPSAMSLHAQHTIVPTCCSANDHPNPL